MDNLYAVVVILAFFLVFGAFALWLVTDEREK